MGITDLIAQQRDKQVLERARPHLEQGEDVLHWARARHPDKRRQGYAFLTDRRLLVVWSGAPDRDGGVLWDEMHTWGVQEEAIGGPVLGVEFDRSTMFVHLPVASHGAAARVTSFLHRFAHLAPHPRWTLLKSGHPGLFKAEPSAVFLPPRSISELTKRALVTVIGLVLFLGGVAIIPIPGPWSLPLMLAGLAILASEYDWAQDALEWLKEKSREARAKLKARRAAR